MRKALEDEILRIQNQQDALAEHKKMNEESGKVNSEKGQQSAVERSIVAVSNPVVERSKVRIISLIGCLFFI